jgi:O-antigen/teichoic acid export membrane protein
MSLKQSAVSGVKWTSTSTVFVVIVQLAQLMALARLLSAREFGLVAMVNLVIGLAQNISDMGVSAAIIHRQDVTKAQLSTLYWINILFGAFLYLVLLLFSPLVAAYFSEPQLKILFPVAALILLINPIGTQFQVLRQKELHFRFIATQDITVALVTAAVTVLLAYLHYGVWALVIGALASSVASTIFYVIPGRRVWKPALKFSIPEVKGFLRFGSFQVGERIANYITYQLDQIIVGSLLGTVALGYYNFAFNLVMKPASRLNPIVMRVAFPVFAKVQAEAERLRRGYILTIKMLSSVNAPLFAAIAVLAPIAMPVFFSTKWNQTIPIVQILCLYAIVRATGNPIGSLQLAKGRADIGFMWTVGVLIVLGPFIFAGAKIAGLVGIACSLLLLETVQLFLLYTIVVRRLLGKCAGSYFLAIFKPMILSFIMAGSMMATGLLHFVLSAKVLIGAEVVTGIVVYALLVFQFEGSLIAEFKGMLKPRLV